MERFKVIKKKNNEYYVSPPYTLLLNYNISQLPFDTNFIIYDFYNFNLIDFYKYIISKYNAQVAVQSTFPFFVFYFTKENAILFAKELDERVTYKMTGGA